MSERLRISRELHDLLGHHLTALSLNLEVAGHLAESPASLSNEGMPTAMFSPSARDLPG